LPRPSPICSSPVTSRGLSHVVLSFNFGFLTDVLMHHVIPGIAYSVPLNLDVRIDFIIDDCVCVCFWSLNLILDELIVCIHFICGFTFLQFSYLKLKCV